MSDLLLLCFRGVKHYWQLCIRQLILPPGLTGESFPYRRDFVNHSVAERKTFANGLICMKFDGSEVHGSSTEQLPVYVPLRFISEISGEFAQDSTLLYFKYRLGCTVDYRNKELTYYSQYLRSAIAALMTKSGTHGIDDDRNLVVRVNCDLTGRDLPEAEETDRWIALTRAISTPNSYVFLRDPEAARSRYSHICYTRVSRLRREGGDALCRTVFSNGRYSFQLRAGTSYLLEVLTTASPTLVNIRDYKYHICYDNKAFAVVDTTLDISTGTRRHELLFRSRSTCDHTLLKLGTEESPPIYSPDILIPVYTTHTFTSYLHRIGPPALFFLGLVFAMVGVLVGVPYLSPNVQGLFKFAAIVFSAGAGVWVYNLQGSSR